MEDKAYIHEHHHKQPWNIKELLWRIVHTALIFGVIATVVVVNYKQDLTIAELKVMIASRDKLVNNLKAQLELNFRKGTEQRQPTAADFIGFLQTRLRRQTSTPNESDHVLDEHHGISSSHIAMIHVDSSAIWNISESAPSSQGMKFSQISMPDANCSGTLMRNAMKDLWCRMEGNGQRDKFMITASDKTYSFFKKASWMENDPRSHENFEIIGDRHLKLKVNHPGMYIIASNMNFFEISSTSSLGYGVYKSNHLGQGEEKISHCGMRDLGDGLIPCPTWMLAPLKAGDQVYMKIMPYNWFQIEKQSMFLALIKLNNYDF